MSRKKKRKLDVNIKSNETKIIFGMILLVAGLTLLITPFVNETTVVFDKIRLFLGYSSIVFGVTLLYISLNLITKGKKFNSWKQMVGLSLASFSVATLLAIWMDPEKMEDVMELSNSGGILGREINLFLSGIVGQFIEIIIILLILIVATSLITNTTLEEITGLVAEPGEDKKFSLKNFFSSFGQGQKEQDPEKRMDALLTSESGDEIDIPIETNEKDIDIETVHEEDIPRHETAVLNKTDEDQDSEENTPKYSNWVFPPIDILKEPETQPLNNDRYKKDALTIERTLKSFDIQGRVVQVAIGPRVVRYSLSISVGTKVSKIRNLGNDLALALASQNSSVRIEAPIPGTSHIGVEIPNPIPNLVFIKDMIEKLKTEEDLYELPLVLGKDITGRTVIKDLADIPHLLVAGATNSGKSVGINSILTGLLYTKTPDELKLIMVDPKMVELSPYNGIPHLYNPVITDMELVGNALQWSIEEMHKRYRILKQTNDRKITEYHKRMGKSAMPYIVIIIDEMADLMLTVGLDVESKIQKIAQMGRAVGIHLILATQRPSVQVITGLIKANVPGRIAFAVPTAMESRIILDQIGGETLLGKGDLLYKDQLLPKPIRIQGAFTDTKDTQNVVKAIQEQVGEEQVEYSKELAQAIEKGVSSDSSTGSSSERDPEFEEALEIILTSKKTSASYLQRRLKIGYNKAARLIEQLEKSGAIGPQEGTRPRNILINSSKEILGNTPDDTEEY